MDLSGIISVAGMGGLYKVIAQTKSGLLVESISDGKRLPVYSTSKVSALEDISIYGLADDIPLKTVFRSIRDSKSGTAIPSAKDSNNQIKDAFISFVPEFDQDRVYASDMKKVFVWYSILLEKGLLIDAAENKEEEETTVDKAKSEKAVLKPKAKEVAKTSSPKASSKGMAKTTTVRKTGG